MYLTETRFSTCNIGDQYYFAMAAQAQPPTQFKNSFMTAEGRYRMAAERFPPSNGVNNRIARATRLTFAQLRGAGDIDGPYLIYNVNETLYISDYNCIDKEPFKCITFTGHLPVCHAYQPVRILICIRSPLLLKHKHHL